MLLLPRLLLTISFCAVAKCASAHPDTAIGNRLRALIANADYAQIISLADSALRTDSTSPHWWGLRGHMRLALKKYPEAITDFQQSIRLDPLNPQAYSGAAECHYELFQFPEAETMYTSAIGHTSIDDSAYAVLLIRRGNTRTYLRKWDAALQDFAGALTFFPDEPGTLLNMTIALYGGGRPDDGREVLNRLYAKDSTDPYVVSNLAFRLGEVGEYEEALRFSNKAIALAVHQQGCGLGYAYSNRAFARMHLGELKEALEDVAQGIKYCPLNSYVYRNKALVLLALHRDAEACQALDEATGKGFAQSYGGEVAELQRLHCAAKGATGK